MDLTLFLIGLSLVFVGAAFFGFPLGHIAGKRQMWKEIYKQIETLEAAPDDVITPDCLDTEEYEKHHRIHN